MRTLRLYLGRDLVKLTGLWTAALTVLLTVLAFLEPLREQGLTGGQAVKYLGYVLPLMFSLTLPFGALFAATMVYGRFSQDNELMASRASGISVPAVLVPAMWLGAVVTGITLALVLYVAPVLLGMAESVVKDDLEQLAFYRLRKRQYVDWGKRILHADRAYPEDRWVKGAVGVDFGKLGAARVMVASSARLDFRDDGGKTALYIHATRPRMFVQGYGWMAREESQPWQVPNLPRPFDQPKAYDWSRLWATRAHPQTAPKVVADLEDARRRICIDRFHANVVRAMSGPGRFYELTGPAASRVRIEAPLVALEREKSHKIGRVVLRSWRGTSPPAGQPPRRVKVEKYVDGKRVRALAGKRAEIEASWEPYQDAPVVRLTVFDAVDESLAEANEEPGTLLRDDMGPFAVPPELVAEARQISLTELYEHPERFRAPGVIARVRDLKGHTVEGLLAKVEAEIHQRLAYGLSCVLMVMMGAGLGLLFRGGQMLAAASLAAIPAALVMLAILMGGQLIANTDVPASHGIAVIWSGFGLLAAATAWLYTVPLRR